MVATRQATLRSHMQPRSPVTGSPPLKMLQTLLMSAPRVSPTERKLVCYHNKVQFTSRSDKQIGSFVVKQSKLLANFWSTGCI